MRDCSKRCAKCGKRSPTRNSSGICGWCVAGPAEEENPRRVESVFDDPLAWDRDQIAEMRGLVE
jgi:hypothetical protein